MFECEVKIIVIQYYQTCLNYIFVDQWNSKFVLISMKEFNGKARLHSWYETYFDIMEVS